MPSEREPPRVSISFGHITQNSFPRVGQHRPGLCASLPDADPLRPRREKPLNLLFAVLRTADQVEVQAALYRLRIGDRHETHANGRVLVSPDDDLALTLAENLSAECLRLEPGQPGQIVSVNNDAMESDRHAVRMRGHRTAPVIYQTHAAVPATGNRTMRWLRRVSGIVWIFSWYTIYLEIFRWQHMTKSLRFNPPPPLPGTDIQPRPGAPLIAVCLGSVAAPLVFLTATMIERMRARPGNTPPRRLASKS